MSEARFCDTVVQASVVVYCMETVRLIVRSDETEIYMYFIRFMKACICKYIHKSNIPLLFIF